MKYLMDLIYIVAAAGYSPVIVYRRLKYGRYQRGWSNRFGKITRKYPQKKCIWIHAVSVGEVNATCTIVDKLSKKFGEYEILITTTTDTGFARANALYGPQFQVCYFPLDFSWIMRRVFSSIRPAICILMELEVWPNFAQTAGELNIPIVVANGRITERSMKRYRLVRPFVKKMFTNVSYILAQTEQYAERFKQLGCDCEKVIVTGSLKYDTAQITDKIEGADSLAKELYINKKRLWVAGGTGNDEEAIILDIYKKLREQKEFADVRLAIVPRKPERFDEVAALIKDKGFDLIRYSRVKNKATENFSATEDTEKKIINHQLSIPLSLAIRWGTCESFIRWLLLFLSAGH
jgi:3-deoxy-D-manno-octulosonic-acid transferase